MVHSLTFLVVVHKKNEILHITLAHFITHLHARGRNDASARVSERTDALHGGAVVTCKGVPIGENRPLGVTAVIFNPLCRKGRD